MRGRNQYLSLLLGIALLLCAWAAEATDWPMWRYDAARSGGSPEQLAPELHLEWIRQYTPRAPVWDDPLNWDLMPYDRIFEPVVAGDFLYLAFNDTDKLVALDTRSGEEAWSFYTDGPVRFAPVVDWGPGLFHERRRQPILPRCRNRRLGLAISGRPPAPAGPRQPPPHLHMARPRRAGGRRWHRLFRRRHLALHGTFIYALDAETGREIWLNDSDAATYQEHPHGGSWSFGGIGPQGAMVVSGDRLLVPGGRSVPAVLDRATGKILHYTFHDNNKTGGSFVCADDTVFFNHYREQVTTMYDTETGSPVVRQIGKYPVLTPDTYFFSGSTVQAYDVAKVKANPETWQEAKRWELPVNASGDLIKAGNCLYAAGGDTIAALKLDPAGGAPSLLWTKIVSGKLERLVAANARLFAVTEDGRIMAFGSRSREPRQILSRPEVMTHSGKGFQQAVDIIERTGVSEGYALFYGDGTGDLLEGFASTSKLQIIAFHPHKPRVAQLRRRFDEVGLYGDRVAVHQGDIFSAPLPPYLASLTVVQESKHPIDEALIERLYASMRPYGGAAWVRGASEEDLTTLVAALNLPGLRVLGPECLIREGALPGAADWTHILGDVAQSGKSNDQLVQAPLGLLWFGGSSNLDVLPRHAHGPIEQIVGGRLFIEGMASMSARDVYTGRVIWKAPLHDLGTYDVYYDETYKDTPTSTRYNQVHIPGANIRGTNFVATDDGLYVIQGSACHVLDPSTGTELRVISLPPIDPEAERPRFPSWGYIGICDDILLGGAGFVAFSDLVQKPRAEYYKDEDFDTSASRGLVAMDRHSGEVQWRIDANIGFLHNATVAGNGLLFCLDTVSPGLEGQLSRRGRPIPEGRRLLACDIHTGDPKWEHTDNIFGSFLCYSVEHDILLQATRPSRDTVVGEEGKRMIAYRGADGNVIWDKEFSFGTFPLLHGDRIITEDGIRSLTTGDPITFTDPLTGQPIEMAWKRAYGCNYPIASEHLLTFRSGSAGYFDLASMGGTGNIGGFKSGCSANLVAANGVLNAPDYTRTCSCSYPNQTSLGLVHAPEAEMWTYNIFEPGDGPVRRVGINFGAPGDRLFDGTLWLDYPAVGGPSPNMQVDLAPEEPAIFLHHSSRFQGEKSWVVASGIEGAGTVTVHLAAIPIPEEPKEDEGAEASEPTPAETPAAEPAPIPERAYTVRLFFAEPEPIEPGARLFDIAIQGQPIVQALDIAKEAGGIRCGLVREIPGVQVSDALTIALAQSPGSAKPPLLCGIEAIAEGW